MIVPIMKPDGDLLEWSMVEIQGRLESLTGEEITEIGTLHVSPHVSPPPTYSVQDPTCMRAECLCSA